MADHYHLNMRHIKRSQGESAVAAVAYQNRMAILDERTGIVHDFSRKKGDLLWSGMHSPDKSVAWTQDAAQAANMFERTEKRKDSRTGFRFIVGLYPDHLSLEQNVALLQGFAQQELGNHVVAMAIHKGHKRQANLHAHFVVSTRELDGQEFAAKKNTELNKKAQLLYWRARWADIANQHLIMAGQKPEVDHRSYKTRGIDKEPGIHLGPAVAALEARGKKTERGNRLREIQARNALRDRFLAAEREATQFRMEVEAEAVKAAPKKDKRFGTSKEYLEWLLEQYGVAAEATTMAEDQKAGILGKAYKSLHNSVAQMKDPKTWDRAFDGFTNFMAGPAERYVSDFAGSIFSLLGGEGWHGNSASAKLQLNVDNMVVHNANGGPGNESAPQVEAAPAAQTDKTVQADKPAQTEKPVQTDKATQAEKTAKAEPSVSPARQAEEYFHKMADKYHANVVDQANNNNIWRNREQDLASDRQPVQHYQREVVDAAKEAIDPDIAKAMAEESAWMQQVKMQEEMHPQTHNMGHRR